MTQKKQLLSTKSTAELERQLTEIRREWIELKLKLARGKLKNVHQPSQKRKEIARIKTVLRERELTQKIKK